MVKFHGREFERQCRAAPRTILRLESVVVQSWPSTIFFATVFSLEIIALSRTEVSSTRKTVHLDRGEDCTLQGAGPDSTGGRGPPSRVRLSGSLPRQSVHRDSHPILDLQSPSISSHLVNLSHPSRSVRHLPSIATV